jgi:PAS domain S-box-containing protein
MPSLPKQRSKQKARRQPEDSGGGVAIQIDSSADSLREPRRNGSPSAPAQPSTPPKTAPRIPNPSKAKRPQVQSVSAAGEFESTFHHAAVGLAHVDMDGRFVRVNPKFAQILGYRSEEMVAMTFMQIAEPDTAVKDLIGLRDLLNGSTDSYSRDKRYLRKDGSHVWCNVNVSLLRSPDGTNDCFVAVLHDISARKQTEEDLARTNELLSISQVAGGTGSFEWIIPENALTWSENHIKMFGLRPAAFDGSFAAWRRCLLPEDLAKVEAQIQTAFSERREEWLTEYRIIRADSAQERWITSRGRIAYDSRGKALLMIGVSIDITDRKLVEEELLRSRNDLERHVHQRTTELVQKTLEMSEQARQLDQANESLRQLSARILHLQDEERRRIASHLHDSTGSWITALSMNLSVLQTDSSNLSAKSKTVLADSLEILRDMSNDLRTVSHLLHPPLLDEMGLQSALRWFVEEFSKRSKIPVEVELAPNLGRLSRECETAIFRVVQEALTNVHRHSGSPRASICITRQDRQIALEVRDWGAGIPELKDGSHARPGVGVQGMRERIRQLGGEFEIRRNPDGGTSVIAKFTEDSVCLPPAD